MVCRRGRIVIRFSNPPRVRRSRQRADANASKRQNSPQVPTHQNEWQERSIPHSLTLRNIERTANDVFPSERRIVLL
jgi:hypothetical protein